MNARLLIGPDLADDAGLPDLQARLRLRGADCVLVAAMTPRALMLAAGAAAPQSWLATRDPAAVMSAATAGLAGVVLVGVTGEDRDAGALVRHSPDLASVPIAMVPRGGGCWHEPAAG